MKTILRVLSLFTCLIQCLSIDENAFPYIFPNVPPIKDLVNSGFEEDGLLDFIGLTKKYGYTSEEHEIITKDGYILTVFRIPRRKACNHSEPPDPVVMMHGLLKSSDTFVTPGVGLAYTLADSCYDVWCANVRGNRYSREHVKWDPDKDKEFWQFSFHEHGTIDLATTVDYVLNETKSEKVSFIGHSQGTTSFFVLTSSRPDYNRKIKVAICLSPVAYLNHIGNPVLKIFSRFNDEIKYLLDAFNIHEVFGKQLLPSRLLEVACQYIPDLCSAVRYIFFLQRTDSTTHTRLKIIAGHVPAGTSAQNLHHFSQNIKADFFRRYDAGVNKNLENYGQQEPPDYDLSKVAAPVVLICSNDDAIATPQDVERLRDELPNVLDMFTLRDPHWGHLDFTDGNDIPLELAPKVLEYLMVTRDDR
ncbi:lipase 3 [Plutella xylostella]|uniref:lipase 3 n=1 Tax=Plutella xylostella TaxID=51655 RepID=UPI002032CB91|nr:lipase 3 [Plutella xylostella]